MPAPHLRLHPSRTDAAVRELVAVREIAQAFLAADDPNEVFALALERVTPLVGASFSSVYVDAGDGTLRLAASHNWPARFRPYLGEMRVRLGRGPSGMAASQRRTVAIPDVFAEQTASDWWDVARELAFRAIIAVPLQTPRRVLGAIAFYFAAPGGVETHDGGLMRIVADQLAATAEKAALIAELRRANAELRAANVALDDQYTDAVEARRAKDEFLSTISHELRSPLTHVLGHTQLLLEEDGDPLTDEQRAALEEVTHAGGRLLSLVDDMLTLTALRDGDVEVDAEEFDPRELVLEVAETTEGRAPGVALALDLAEPVPAVRSDRHKVGDILRHLLRNAYKFTPAGEVRLSVVEDGGCALFTVRDTGVGVPPELRHVIFDEFRQGDGSLTRRYGGAGLGLALARRLATILGGEILLDETGGRGSAFAVALPLHYGGPRGR